MTNLCISVYYDYDDLITVLAGEDEMQFQVHRTNICERSKFFKAAVSDQRWIEGQQNLVRLPEVSPANFQMYVHWAYTGKLSPEVFWTQLEGNLNSDKEQRAYYAAYILGDILDDEDLRTLSLETMITKSANWKYMPSVDTCQDIWEKTPKGSPLRAFIVGWKADAEAQACFSAHVEGMPREFLEEMTVYLLGLRPENRKNPADFVARMRAELLPEQEQ